MRKVNFLSVISLDVTYLNAGENSGRYSDTIILLKVIPTKFASNAESMAVKISRIIRIHCI